MIPYIGGKSFLANWIIANFPENFRELTYVEPFGGGGWVLFKKPESNCEVYNDHNKELVNLFRMMRDKYPEFEYRAQWSLHSREMYQEAIQRLAEDTFISEVERALHYAVVRTQTFSGGNSKSWGYQIRADKLTSGKWLPFLRKMEAINARLKRTQIECLDFEKLIKKYDSPTTLFYCDPPYYECEQYYDVGECTFGRADHERLAGVLRGIQGKFALSYYDHRAIRKLYKGFRILKKAGVKHSAGASNGHRVGYVKPRSIELLIMNY